VLEAPEKQVMTDQEIIDVGTVRGDHHMGMLLQCRGINRWAVDDKVREDAPQETVYPGRNVYYSLMVRLHSLSVAPALGKHAGAPRSPCKAFKTAVI
jgi:hypothetical protein